VGSVAVELRGAGALDDARAFLLASEREELVALFGRAAATEDGPLFLVQAFEIAPEDLIWRDLEGLHWKPELTRRWTHRAEDADQGVVLLHAHGQDGGVSLSETDRRTCRRMLEHFETAIPTQAHGYGVIGRDAIAGCFAWKGERFRWMRMKTVACPVQVWTPRPPAEGRAPMSMARQVAAITEAGQARMRAATVALVGAGGAGSMLANQLAHMGVGSVLICDQDVVKDVNLSRQDGAGPANVGARKAEVTADLMRHASPSIRVQIIPERFPSTLSHIALRLVDVIVSCVDGAHARHEINKFCRRYLIPLVDVGATIRRDGDKLALIAGHTIRVLPDGACLECEGLTTAALRERELAGRDVPYWEGDDAPGAPQVMSVNGVLASLAGTEVLRLIAGLSEDRQTRHFRYEALGGEVYAREPLPRGCAVCAILGRGDE
jgi:molybdopterin/thiamine biosynthesis adenylyltransferase